MRGNGFVRLALSACVILAAGASQVRADIITTVTPTVTQLSASMWLYNYTVANSASSTVGVAEFDLTIRPGVILTSITAPTGFLPLFTPGDAEIDFVSSDPTTDIAIGKSAVFSFQADAGPLLNAGLARGFDATGAPFQQTLSTLTPAAVPEPSVLVLSALSGLAVLGLRAYRRVRRPAV